MGRDGREGNSECTKEWMAEQETDLKPVRELGVAPKRFAVPNVHLHRGFRVDGIAPLGYCALSRLVEGHAHAIAMVFQIYSEPCTAIDHT